MCWQRSTGKSSGIPFEEEVDPKAYRVSVSFVGILLTLVPYTLFVEQKIKEASLSLATSKALKVPMELISKSSLESDTDDVTAT